MQDNSLIPANLNNVMESHLWTMSLNGREGSSPVSHNGNLNSKLRIQPIKSKICSDHAETAGHLYFLCSILSSK